MEKLILERKELYEKVWNTPLSKLAKKYGTNTYQLTKACEELNIPRPESGYWSKVRNGKKVKPRPALPKHDQYQYEVILELNPVNLLAEKLPKKLDPPTLKENLKGTHKLVRKTYKHLKNKKRGDSYGRFKAFHDGYLGLLVTKDQLKRALLIMDALIKELERQGYEISGEASQKVTFTTVSNETDVIYLRLMEEGSFNKTKSDDKAWRTYDYDYYTTGILRLSISAYSSTDWGNTITESNNSKLEDQFDKIFLVILETFDAAKKRRLWFEKREREAEQNRIISERIRKERESELKKQKELESAAESFTKSQYIYQFIEEIKGQLATMNLSCEEDVKFRKWLIWAERHADHLNPVKQQIQTILEIENKCPLKLKKL